MLNKSNVNHLLPWLNSLVATTSNGVIPMLKNNPLIMLDANGVKKLEC